MKTLQSNFTTPEQSKRLLELGVPADSANMIYGENADIKDGVVVYEWGEPELLPISVITGKQILYSEYIDKYTSGGKFNLPCWSVGRLMEIFDTCLFDTYVQSVYLDWCNVLSLGDMRYIDYLVLCYENAIEHKQLDFSKLED